MTKAVNLINLLSMRNIAIMGYSAGGVWASVGCLDCIKRVRFRILGAMLGIRVVFLIAFLGALDRVYGIFG